MVYVYLIHVTEEGTESVEFSGRTDAFALEAGEPTSPEVTLVRGPIANLFVTSVVVTSPPAVMAIGTTQALVAGSTTTGTTGPTIFWTSLDAGVLTVAGSAATAVAYGTARVVASAGAFADTVSIVVPPPETMPPTVVSTLPAGGASGVSTGVSVRATFDEALDPSTVTASTFRLADAVGSPIAGSVSFSDLVATFDPTVTLDTLATYTATLTTGIRDVSGNALQAPYSWSFTTRSARAAVVSSFPTGLGILVGIGFDPLTGNTFVHPRFATTIHEFTSAGAEVLPTLVSPGISSNDYDLEFAPVPITLGTTLVPANTLIIMNGEDVPRRVYALDKNNGTVLASLPTTLTDPVGMAYHPGRGTFFAVDWVVDNIVEISPATGAVLATFSVNPVGAPLFGVFYGDIEVDQETGRLLVVSSDQSVVRVLTPTGALVEDVNVAGVGVTGMSGIAWDDASQTAWISNTSGTVYQVRGIGSAP